MDICHSSFSINSNFRFTLKFVRFYFYHDALIKIIYNTEQTKHSIT
jgi:hypothetical protein